MAARGYLPPGANVCGAAHAYQISPAIRVFFRISDMGCEPTIGGPYLFPPFPFLITLPFSTPSPPVLWEYSPLNSVRRSGERCKLPQQCMGRSPGRNWIGIFSLKICHLVARSLKIFLIIKSPNFVQDFQILCWIWIHVNSAKHWIAIASKAVTAWTIWVYSFTAGEWSVRSAV